MRSGVRTKWFYLHSVGFGNTEATVSGTLGELRSLPEELPLYQKQLQRFFELILDIDKAGRISDSVFFVWMEPLYRFLYTYLCYNLCKHLLGAILKKGDITMYYAKNTKVCATCGYWGGERRVVSNGNSSEPTSTSAKCQHPTGPNRNCARPGSNTCPCWTLWPPLR